MNQTRQMQVYAALGSASAIWISSIPCRGCHASLLPYCNFQAGQSWGIASEEQSLDWYYLTVLTLELGSNHFSRERLRRVLRKKAAVILHLHIFTSADLDLHTFTSADLHLHTLIPADLDLHTFTPADLDLHTFTSADLHLHTFTPADLHLHTFTSADLHLHTLTSADLHLHTP